MSELTIITMRGPGPVKHGGHRLIARGVYAVPRRFADLAIYCGWADATPEAEPMDHLPDLQVPAGIIDGATGRAINLAPEEPAIEADAAAPYDASH